MSGPFCFRRNHESGVSGRAGAFSESAAQRLLGEAATLPFASFEEMFAAVSAGEADCCIAPIENNLAGSIHRN